MLALSGGLDTSFCAVYLRKEQGYHVHSAVVQTGGFTGEELEHLEHHAHRLGVESHRVLDGTHDYYRQCIRYLVYGNVLRNRNYPVSVSSERFFQAIALVRYAREHGFTRIAHGSTAAGNDQVRFDLAIRVLAPEIEVVTPIRELKLTRDQEVAYLEEQGISVPVKEKTYSVNKGLWGTSVGGKETLSSHQALPDEAYPSGEPPEGSQEVTLSFREGELVAVDGDRAEPVSLIRRLEAIGNRWAIGRDVHVGDTIIGIKGRVGFEAAAPALIIDAHLALEKHVLTRWQLHWKEQVGNWYGMFVHEAQFLEPVMRDLEAFLASSQQAVTGDVFVHIRPFSFRVTGVKSDYDLMDDRFASYGEENRDWSAADVDGFTRILANQQMIWHRKHRENNE